MEDVWCEDCQSSDNLEEIYPLLYGDGSVAGKLYYCSDCDSDTEFYYDCV